MVPDVFEDLRDDTGALCFYGWRCVICGEILDKTILDNREAAAPPFPRSERKRKSFLPMASPKRA
jgi:hypothetical protein